MRKTIVVLGMLLGLMSAATAQVSIGINLPVYPELVRVPDYPVYYAPRLNANYFFYDGLYWVYQGDAWYASSWYNGPWGLVAPNVVPLFILRIPVRYYREPPAYFRGWRPDAPPRWDEHWGNEWRQRRPGWDEWDRRAAPPPAPLPAYQREYRGERYPRTVERQQALQSQHYRYQPREDVVQRHVQQQRETAQPQSGARDNAPRRDAGPQRVPHQTQRSERDNERGKGADNDRSKGRDKGRDDDRGRGREK